MCMGDIFFKLNCVFYKNIQEQPSCISTAAFFLTQDIYFITYFLRPVTHQKLILSSHLITKTYTMLH